ncbi:MAG: YidC/Oxa1 family membrane protein insertase [Chloroflexi bacterium]|nr:YidC/Oxa1 family membrane protein insertase [Chloroflexota bacterium]
MLHTIFVEPLVFLLETFNKLFVSLGVPYSYGFAIIAVTLFLRLLMLPLTLKSMSSMRRMQELQPQLDALKKKYKNDQQKLLQAQQALYREAGVNPLGGCLPMLIQMPILFGFYYAVRELAQSGKLVNQPFFWIPDLAFPDVSQGLSWLWPLPPSVGWETAIRYLILPILLVITQILTQKLSTSQSSTSDNPQAKAMNQMMWLMSFMFFYITLTVPSALTLYWVTSNILGLLQQLYVNRFMSLEKGKGTAVQATASGTSSPALESQSDVQSGEEKTSSPEQRPAKRRKRKKRR